MPTKRPKVLVLYVGGTLGMAPNEHGALEPKKGYLTQEMKRMTEFSLASMPLFDILEYEVLFDSSDMGPDEWGSVAKDIYDNYNNYDGFLVAHGTDTMHYTATALSFMLYNLSKPVILTGAMVPLIETYNDARRNLIIGMMFAANTQLCEVCIFFHDKLMRGNRCLKVGVTVDAFMSPNIPALAEVSGDTFVVREELLLPQPTGPLTLHSNMTARVMSVGIVPEFDFLALETYVADLGKRRTAAKESAQKSGKGKNDRKDGTGSSSHSTGATTTSQRGRSFGAAALQDDPIPKEIRAIVLEIGGIGDATGFVVQQLVRLARVAARSGVLLMLVSETAFGPIHNHSVRRLLSRTSAYVDLRDMTSSAAMVKLVYLIGLGLSGAEVRKWMPVNIRGEVMDSKMTHYAHL